MTFPSMQRKLLVQTKLLNTKIQYTNVRIAFLLNFSYKISRPSFRQHDLITYLTVRNVAVSNFSIYLLIVLIIIPIKAMKRIPERKSTRIFLTFIFAFQSGIACQSKCQGIEEVLGSFPYLPFYRKQVTLNVTLNYCNIIYIYTYINLFFIKA